MNWKNAKTETPSLIKKYGFEPPYVCCLVWVASEGYLECGVFEAVRWATDSKEWLKADLIAARITNPNEITHFCDEVPHPTE